MRLSVVLPLVQYTLAFRDSSLESLANELQGKSECRARDRCVLKKMQEYADTRGEGSLDQALKSSFEEECLTPCKQYQHWGKACTSDEVPIETLSSALRQGCISCTEQEVRDECEVVHAANSKVAATKEQCMIIPVTIDKTMKKYSKHYCKDFESFLGTFSRSETIGDALVKLGDVEDEPDDASAEASAAVDAAWQHASAAVSSKRIEDLQAATNEVAMAQATSEAATSDQGSRESDRTRKRIEMAGVDYGACLYDKPMLVDVLCSSYAPICGQSARPVWSNGGLSC